MEIYGEFFAPLGVSDQITVVIATPLSELLAGVSVDRGSNGFHDADRLLLDMLRPHLEQAFQNAVRYAVHCARRFATPTTTLPVHWSGSPTGSLRSCA